jgi:hypothetical protein
MATRYLMGQVLHLVIETALWRLAGIKRVPALMLVPSSIGSGFFCATTKAPLVSRAVALRLQLSV